MKKFIIVLLACIAVAALCVSCSETVTVTFKLNDTDTILDVVEVEKGKGWLNFGQTVSFDANTYTVGFGDFLYPALIKDGTRYYDIYTDKICQNHVIIAGEINEDKVVWVKSVF